MMTSTETLHPSSPPVEPTEAAGCLVIKTQLCGKDNCRCVKLNSRHGPYCWLVSYVSVSEKKEGKKYTPYKWQYLGSAHKQEKTLAKLRDSTNDGSYPVLEGKLKGFFTQYAQDEAFRKRIHATKKTPIT